jgi:beta-alanine degradation protein BauB
MKRIGERKQAYPAIALAFASSLALAAPAAAQQEAPSYQASPDIYKVIAENEHFRVIEAHWKPGQRDAWHSHAGPGVLYRLTDCDSRNYLPNGKILEGSSKKGSVGFFPVVASHSVENTGASDCEMVIVEPK